MNFLVPEINHRKTDRLFGTRCFWVPESRSTSGSCMEEGPAEAGNFMHQRSTRNTDQFNFFGGVAMTNKNWKGSWRCLFSEFGVPVPMIGNLVDRVDLSGEVRKPKKEMVLLFASEETPNSFPQEMGGHYVCTFCIPIFCWVFFVFKQYTVILVTYNTTPWNEPTNIWRLMLYFQRSIALLPLEPLNCPTWMSPVLHGVTERRYGNGGRW